MMKNRSNIFLVFLLLGPLFFISCSKELDYKEYSLYINNKSNGLIRTKSINGIKFSVQYIPTDLLVYNEIANIEGPANNSMVDSIKKTYSNSVTFKMTIGPEDENSLDITRVGVSSFEEFNERITTMSFNMGEFIKLKTEDKEILPDIAQMERLYGLKKSADILVIFNKNNIPDDISDLVFVYNDQIFYSGIIKFRFSKDDINNIPELIFN